MSHSRHSTDPSSRQPYPRQPYPQPPAPQPYLRQPQQYSAHCRPPGAGWGQQGPSAYGASVSEAQAPYGVSDRDGIPRGTVASPPAGGGYGAPYGATAQHHPPRRMPRPPAPRPAPRRQSPSSVLLASASGGAVALALLAIVPQVKPEATPPATVCEQVVSAQSVLGREALSELLAVPERASRDRVREIVAEPYCQLNSTEVREGVMAEREAYPLAFDPQTWFIVLYEDGEYAGYDFSFTREAQ